MIIHNYNFFILDEELETLKQEFHHHQEKVDEYMSLLKGQSKDSEKSES